MKSIQVNKRNQIINYEGTSLSYDANGNLKQFHDRYIYDWKNQLIKVEKGNGEVVEFRYDPLGRRISKKLIAGGKEQTTNYYYDGWRVIEERDGTDRVKTRYTYGNGIDEVIEIEKDRDGDGNLEKYYPLQNTIGSVIGIVDKDGELVERVNYTPYGIATFIYDKEQPKVDNVFVISGKIKIRFSEKVNQEKAKSAIRVKKGATLLLGEISFEEEGRLTVFTPSEPLPQNQTLTITISTELEDLNGNRLEREFNQEFVYSGNDLIIYDRIAPEVELVRLNSGRFYIEFSEEVDQSSITESIELSSSSGALQGQIILENPKTIKFTPSTSLSRNVQYAITVKPTVKDLSGKSLSEQFSRSFTYTGGDILIFEKPDPNKRTTSYISNTTLFQGREYDPETGLYYFRARYYHPELGRFLSPDPAGYIDSDKGRGEDS